MTDGLYGSNTYARLWQSRHHWRRGSDRFGLPATLCQPEPDTGYVFDPDHAGASAILESAGRVWRVGQHRTTGLRWHGCLHLVWGGHSGWGRSCRGDPVFWDRGANHRGANCQRCGQVCQ